MGEIALKDWIQQLLENEIGKVMLDEPLSKHTTWKIGGPADAFIEPINHQSLILTLEILKRHNVPWKVLGKGSNLLVLDKGFRGAIISLKNHAFQEVIFQDSYVRVGSSLSFIRLSNLAAKQGLTGLEFAGGIPGTVGGAVYMNAGAHGSDISKILREAEIILETGDLFTWSNEDFNFGYRSSLLQERKGIVLSALFKLEPGDRKIIAREMASNKDRRRRTQPYNMPCTGSVFRNPQGDYAGRLIEALELKGFQIGGAQVSTVHANFIVNTGQATAKDVLRLISYIKEEVLKNFNITLVEEVEMVGEG